MTDDCDCDWWLLLMIGDWWLWPVTDDLWLLLPLFPSLSLSLIDIVNLPHVIIIVSIVAAAAVAACPRSVHDKMGLNMHDTSSLFGSTIGKLGAMLSSNSSQHMYYLVLFVVFVFLVIYFMMGRK